VDFHSEVKRFLSELLDVVQADIEHRLCTGRITNREVVALAEAAKTVDVMSVARQWEALESAAAKKPQKRLTPRQRYLVLERDNFSCQYCGVRASDGARLEVDHIKPKSLGGSGDPENLKTSCWSCNMGKSDRYGQQKGTE
jgi:hypothetical protein